MGACRLCQVIKLILEFLKKKPEVFIRLLFGKGKVIHYSNLVENTAMSHILPSGSAALTFLNSPRYSGEYGRTHSIQS